MGRLVAGVAGRVPDVSDPDVARDVLNMRQKLAPSVLNLVKDKRKTDPASCPGIAAAYFETLDDLVTNQAN